MPITPTPEQIKKLRSRYWFDNPANTDMTAIYLERYMNYGLTREELSSGKPIIGIAQSGSDLSPCNRHHLVLAQRVREGIREAGGVAFEFPVHPIQETGKRPTAALDRNLAYLGLVEILYGYPIDGVVLTTGCDKTTPSQLMAAATVDIPAIVLSGGPMLNGWFRGERSGSGTIVWKARQMLAAGEIDNDEFIELVASSAPSPGHCNTMGTASTMNSLAEALGMSLPGCAAIPAPHKERAQIAYETGRRIVDMVWEDLRPSRIMTREAFENVIAVNSAIGGSTNAPIHFNAIARHVGVELDNDDWEKVGYAIPLLVNVQPTGKYLGEEYHRAGGVPAVVNELMQGGKIHTGALTVNGKTIGENCAGRPVQDADVIRPYAQPLQGEGRVPQPEGQPVRQRHHEDQRHLRGVPHTLPGEPRAIPNAFEGRAIVFDGPEDYHKRIDDPGAADRRDLPAVHARRRAGRLSRRGRGGEHAPPQLPHQEGGELAPLHRRRPPVRHLGLALDPQRLAGGRHRRRPRHPQDGRPRAHRPQQAHRRHSDLRRRSTTAGAPSCRATAATAIPAHQTPWQEIQRGLVDELSEGMVLKPAVKYQRIAATKGIPRDNH